MSVDKSNQRIRRMFAAIAPRYDLLNHLLSLNVDRYWRWRTVRLAPPENNAPILDVCTGTGDLAFAYYKRTGDKVSIVASDFCPQMLQVGQQKKARAAVNGRLAFVEADAQCLPFKDDYFQLVTAAFGLRNVADTDQGLREMTRVCQAGGRVAILEFSMPRIQPFKSIYRWYFQHLLPRVGQVLMRNRESAYSYLPQSVGEFPSGEALADRMKHAGLGQVSFFPLTLGIATLYLGRK